MSSKTHPRHVYLSAAKLTSFPVSLGTIKTQNRIDHNEFDSLITEILLPAAIIWAEGYMKRAIVSRTHTLGMRAFPSLDGGRIHILRGNIPAVESIAYVTNNTTTTLNNGPTSATPGTDWQELSRSDNGVILMPAYGEDWPDTDDDVASPVTITFTAGWDEDDVPSDVKLGLIKYIRAAIDEEPTDQAESFLNPYRVSRWR